MKQNMGPIDRIMRIIFAVVFAWLYFNGIVTGTWGIVLLVLGGVFLLSGLVGTCPLYSVFGLNTCQRKTNAK